MGDVRTKFQVLESLPPAWRTALGPAVALALLLLALLAAALIGGGADRSGPAAVAPTGSSGPAAVAPTGSSGPDESPSAAATPSAPSARVSGTWQATASLQDRRELHSAVLLADGRVLVTGGYADPLPGTPLAAERLMLATAELFDPRSETWSPTGSMASARSGAAIALLRDGTVLVAGGFGDADGREALATAETYDPATGRWTATGALHRPSASPAIVLPDGRVFLASGEVYDPAERTWTVLADDRDSDGDSATLLPDGSVLIAGGEPGGLVERFDPLAGTSWQREPSLPEPFGGHVAALLPDGRVLVAGGAAPGGSGAVASTHAALRDPVTGAWVLAASLDQPRLRQAATQLPDGTILVCGGRADGGPNSPTTGTCELFSPATSSWTPAASLIIARDALSLTTLADGRVLAVGGASLRAGDGMWLSTSVNAVEIWTPAP